jgi:hypothetical protein
MPRNKIICCNPLQTHKKQITNNVHPVDDRIVALSYGMLKKGDLICANCKTNIVSEPEVLKEIYLASSNVLDTDSDMDSISEGSEKDTEELASTYKFFQEHLLPLMNESPIKTSKHCKAFMYET